MPNPENLIPNTERTPKQRKENATKAGKASGEARRKKKAIRECLQMLLDSEVSTDKDGKPIDGNTAMAITAFKAAVQGDWKAWELVRDTAGQKPVDKVIVADIEKDVIAEVEAMVLFE